MKTKLIAIGNSRGIRIPAVLIEELGLKDEVELTPSNGSIVLTPVRRIREGWAEAIAAATEEDINLLVDDDLVLNDFDQKEWVWP